jgi:hypothetical protein
MVVAPVTCCTLTDTSQRALRLARQVHAGQLNRRGTSVLEHVERVAAGVPPVARPVAYVHDVCERSPLSPRQVTQIVGLSPDECQALELMTRREDESVLDHTRRIVDFPRGYARAIAVAVKRADLVDHLEQAAPEPPYTDALAMLDER